MDRTGVIATRVAALLAALSLCGCSPDYYARRDTLSPGSGNAIKADIVAQVADPHPASADRIGGTTDGEYLQHAMERYANPAAGTALATPPQSVVPVLR